MRKFKYNNKGYIVDTIYGKEIVRKCDSNIAKMKIREWCYYKMFHWGFYGEALGLIAEQGSEVIKNALYLTFNLMSILLSPLIIVLMARRDIKRSKDIVHRHKNIN